MREHPTVAFNCIRHQGGQTLILFVIFVVVLILGVVLLFDTGQTVSKKSQLNSAADAAAYSVAVQQARAYNYAAYMNRARIANEVSIAQLISASSWQSMLHSHTVIVHRLAQTLQWVPYLGPVLNVIAQAGEIIMQTGRAATTPLALAAVPVLSTMNTSYALSSDLMLNEFAGGYRGVGLAEEVIQRNDTTAQLDTAGRVLLSTQLARANSSSSVGLLDRHQLADRDGMNRFRNVVMASRDEFSVNRSNSWDFPLSYFPCPRGLGLCRNLRLNAAGGTDMVDYDRWAAADGKQFSYQYFRCRWNGCGWRTSRTLMGMGGAQAVMSSARNYQPGIRSGGSNQTGAGWYDERSATNHAQYGNVLSYNTINGNLIDQCPSVNCPQRMYGNRPSMGAGWPNRRDDATYRYYQGLRPYHDLKADVGQTPEGPNAGPVFTAYIFSQRVDPGDDSERPDAHRTSEMIDGLGGEDGSALELKGQLDRVTALATAQTYFYRPPLLAEFRRRVRSGWSENLRFDDQIEHGSLFSPYWQARLVETPASAYVAVGISEIFDTGYTDL